MRAVRVAEGLERVAGHGLDGNQQATELLDAADELDVVGLGGAGERPRQAELVSVASGTPSTPGVSEASPRVCGSLAKPPTSTECCGER